MKFHSPMLIVSDITISKQFYMTVLGEAIEQDLGTYVVFSGGFSMMTENQWELLTQTKQLKNSSKAYQFELYFEEEAIESFETKIRSLNISVLTPLAEAPWGQRALRLLDPDGYAIEVAESMASVVKRLLNQGLNIESVSDKTMMPLEFIQKVKASE